MITTDQFTISVINDGTPGGIGPTGPAGATISSERDQYYYSTSNTSLTGGSWSYTPTTPIPSGKFLWTRREITMTDSSVKYSNAVYNSTMQNVILDVDRLNGEITSKVEQADITNSINNYDNTIASAIRNRVTQTEQDISGITSRVADVETISDDLGTRMTTAESNISQNADNIELKVSKDGVISSINQSSESVQINANKVNINGAVTFSSFNNDLQNRFTTVETDSSDAANKVNNSIKQTTMHYLATAASTGVTRSTSGWTTTIQSITSTNRYLWTYQTITKVNDSTTYTDPVISGVWGNTGTSVTITSKSVTYAQGESGTIAPNSGWGDTVPDVAQGKYLWTKTVVNYSDGNSTTAYSVAREGANGTNGVSPTVTNTAMQYAQSTNGSTPPSSGWQNTPPTATAGQYMWTKTTSTYSDGATSESYSVSKNGTNGGKGDTGIGVTKVEQLYRTSSSTTAPAAPTSLITSTSTTYNTWTLAMPTYNASYPYYYTCTQTQYTEGNPTWSSVARSKALEDANTTAVAADGKATTANNWITNNGSSVLTAKDIISNWAEDATSATTTIKGGLITTNTITADQLATDAIMSSNYVSPTASTTPFSSDGSFFDLSNGDIVTPSFTVDHDGTTKLGDNNSYISFDKTTGQLSARVSSISIGSNAVATQNDVTTAVNNMKMQYLVLSHAAIQKNISGVYNPTSITMTAKQQAGNGAVSDYTGRFKIETTTNNSTWTAQHTTGDVSSYTYTIPANIIAVRCSLYKQGGTTTLLDQQTLPIVSDGAKGDPGQTGTSVTITSKSVEYKEGTSGTEAPTGNWSSTIPSVAPGKYLWTKTVVNYSDGNSTTAYSVAREGANGTNGTNGTSPTVSSTDRKYAQTTNGTTPPASSSSDWKTSPPTAVAGQYMWTKTTVTYSDGATSESYTVSKNGTNGGNGINTATVYLYQRATSQPSKPSNALTYTFSTCTLSGTLGSWQQSIPTGTNPCWITFATASGTGTTDEIASTEWATPIKLEGVDGQNGQPGTNGTNGYNQATIFLYQRSTSTPSKPTGSITYTFSTGALSQVPTNWSRTVPQNNGNPCYVTTATAFSNTTTDTIASTDWSDVVKLVEDGNDGADAYTVILTNENHTFVGDTTSAITTSVDCNVIAYKGATQVAATIGTITGQPTGMTTAVQNNSSTTAKFTVTVSTSMVSPHGVLAVPVTVDGKTFDMTFTYSLVLMGEKGDTGVGISSVTELYYGSDSSTAPAKPTEHVTTSNFTTYNEWNLQCPTWTLTYQYYYTCQEILYDDGTYSWSDVVMNKGYSGANSRANAALTSADAANNTASNSLKRIKIYSGTTDTEVGSSTKLVTCSDNDFSQTNGVTIIVTFGLGHTANSLYLNVNNKGAKQVYFNNNVVNSSNLFKFGPLQKVTFRYNGTYWIVTNFESESYFVSTTSADTSSKSVAKSDVSFVLYKGAKINVYFSNANTYGGALSLNVYGTGAYNIRYKNAAVSSSNKFQWSAGTTIPFTFDGTYWHVSDGGAVDAKTTAVEAAKTATNYLYYDSTNGLVVHQSNSEISGVSDLTGNVGNVRITGDGMDIYRGQTKTASYGSEVVIGPSILSAESPSNIRINTNGFQYNNGGDEAFYVGVEQRVAEVSEESTQNAVLPEDTIDRIVANDEYVYVGDLPPNELRLTMEVDPNVPEAVIVCDSYLDLDTYTSEGRTKYKYKIAEFPLSNHLTLKRLKPNSVVRTSDGAQMEYSYYFAVDWLDHDEIWVYEDYHVTYRMVTYKAKYNFISGSTFKVIQESNINPGYYDLLRHEIDNDHVLAVLNNTNDISFIYRNNSDIVQVNGLNYFKIQHNSMNKAEVDTNGNIVIKGYEHWWTLSEYVYERTGYETKIIDNTTYYKAGSDSIIDSRSYYIDGYLDTAVIDGIAYYKIGEHPLSFSLKPNSVQYKSYSTHGSGSVQYYTVTKTDTYEIWAIDYIDVVYTIYTNEKNLLINAYYNGDDKSPIDYVLEIDNNIYTIWVPDYHGISVDVDTIWTHYGLEHGNDIQIVDGQIYTNHYDNYFINYDNGDTTADDEPLLVASSDTTISSNTFIERAELAARTYYKVYDIPENVIVKSVVKSSDHSIAEYYIQNNELWVADDFNVIYIIAYVGDTTSPYFVFGPNNYSSALPAGKYSFAAGEYCSAQGSDQFVIGKYNERKTSPAFIIGNGEADNNRSNALEIDWHGNVMTYGSLYSENDDITPTDINSYVFR